VKTIVPKTKTEKKPHRYQPPTIAPVVLRGRDAAFFVGLKPTQFSKHVRLGHLPQPVKLTDDGRAVAWLRTELEAWLAARVAKRDTGRAA
jgi:predicted DNA-binding transcriptional regulator AlpA